MKNKIENATIEELKNGFILRERSVDKAKIYTCLFCHAQYDAGDIYTFKKLLVNGEKAIRLHIAEEHGGVFNSLIATDKELTGLTDTQKEFLKHYHDGLADKEIAEKMNISASTVRYQRFSFREKAKQAKMILAMSELLEEIPPAKPVVESEMDILFESVSPLVLKTFDFKKKKEEKRIFILKTIAQQFEKDKKYNEKEVNAILKPIYEDYATIRRSLIDYGFMGRTNDCREYWVK